MQEIPENVKDFVWLCGEAVANKAREGFVSETFDSLPSCDSPIEQLFETALCLILKLSDNEADFYQDGERFTYSGIYWSRQQKIENYRVDYALSVERITAKRVIIESMIKTKNSADTKKKRDRFFQKQGFQVFRFTGAEIVQDPFKAVIESISYLLDENEEVFNKLISAYGVQR